MANNNFAYVNNLSKTVNTNSLPKVNTNILPAVNTNNLPKVNTNSLPAVNTMSKTVQIRSPNQASAIIPKKTKINKIDNTNDIILIDDDLTTVDSTRKEDVNIMSETETPESYENNSNDLALYSNDNNETSITVDDIIEKTEEITIDTKIHTIVENIQEDDENIQEDDENIQENDENIQDDDDQESDDINIIENNGDSSEVLLLDDSNEASTSSTELKKKNQKSICKMNEIPIISDSLKQILSTKKEIICTDTSDKNETSEDDEELDVNIDIDEIVNESSNNKFKMKTLKRKKLADLQKIASEYGISLNKVKEGKLKNKTKNELCKEIVSKQY